MLVGIDAEHRLLGLALASNAYMDALTAAQIEAHENLGLQTPLRC